MDLSRQRFRLLFLVLFGATILLGLRVFAPTLTDVALTLYGWANRLNAVVAGPINTLRLGVGVPAVGAFLLGLLAATAPCQLSTNAAAVAFFSKDAVSGGVWGRVLLFLTGKTLVYLTLAGIAVWLFGGSFSAPGPLLIAVRRVLGPLMILLGLVTLGWLRLRFALPTGGAARLQTWAESRGGMAGSLSLGAAFGLAFCPTLFWLFFGLMLPSALASSTGVLFPALFALGTGVPLLLMLGLISYVSPKREVMGGMHRFHRALSVLAGAVLILAGLYDTVVYWLI